VINKPIRNLARIALCLASCVGLFAQSTAISDTLTNSVGGSSYTGRIVVTLNSPSSAQPLYYSTTSLSGWQYTLCIGVTGSDCSTTTAAGTVTISLYANSTITPAGSSYSARYSPAKGSPWVETWVVTPSTTKLYQVRSTTVPTPTTMFSVRQITGILPIANGGTGVVALFAANAQTTTYQVLAADFAACKTITVASGTFTITLVASGTQPTTGQCITVLNYGTGVVTLARSGQNINGAAANLTGTAGSATAPTGWRVYSDGTNYFAEVITAGAGSGATSISGLTDLQVTRTSSTLLGIAAGKGRIGEVVTAYSAATATLSGAVASSTAYVYIDAAGVLTVGHNGAATVTCSGCTTATSISAFPTGSQPLATATYTSTAWDVSGITDKRAITSRTVLAAGIGVGITTGAAGVQTIAASGLSGLTTVGAVPYVSATGVLNQDAATFFWDSTNKRLGVGTASPINVVDINTTATFLPYPFAIRTSWNSTYLGLSTFNGNASYIDSSGMPLNLRTVGGGQQIAFFPNYTEAGRFAYSGNFLIGGTTDGNYRLDVQKSGSSGTLRVYDQTATTGVTTLVARAGAGQSTNDVFAIQDNTSAVKFHIRGDGIVDVGGIGAVVYLPDAYVNGTLLRMSSTSYIGFSSGSGLGTSMDTALYRNAAGVLEINNGTAGTYQDLKIRSLIGGGTIPTISSGTMGTGSTNIAGFFTSTTTGAYTPVLTFIGTTAPTGWACSVSNNTTANLIRQSAKSPTTATFSGTTVTGDVITYVCHAY